MSPRARMVSPKSSLKLSLDAYGTETRQVPIRVEILDSAMRLVAERWGMPSSDLAFELEPGIYGIRASVGSGGSVHGIVEVSGPQTQHALPIHELSPHESHEWAHFARAIDTPREARLGDAAYDGVWMRVWERDSAGWSIPKAFRQGIVRDTASAEGVTYRFDPPDRNHFFALQSGGLNVPWRITALPPTHEVRLLLQPSDRGGTDPLDVVASSLDWRVETLLSLMDRGDMSSAKSWASESHLAEEMLQGKVADPASAAVGGYFLLKVRDLRRMHGWAANLANWFDWLPDGCVIHAWQLMSEERTPETLGRARDQLVKAVRRGFPLYTEGLRLLRDGLLMIRSVTRNSDSEVNAALEHVARYYAAADLGSPLTSFLGADPGTPSEIPGIGIPLDLEPILYVQDVPIDELLLNGMVQPGDVVGTRTEKGLGAIIPGEDPESLEPKEAGAFSDLKASFRMHAFDRSTGTPGDVPTSSGIIQGFRPMEPEGVSLFRPTGE